LSGWAEAEGDDGSGGIAGVVAAGGGDVGVHAATVCTEGRARLSLASVPRHRSHTGQLMPVTVDLEHAVPGFEV
jgi:hypothetical protein